MTTAASSRTKVGFGVLLCLAFLLPTRVHAHVSEQGFVLLLPTNIYIGTGVLAVILTIALLAFLPASLVHRLYSAKALRSPNAPSARLDTATSCLFALILIALLVIGVNGSHDPLKNPLPLFIWTLFWMGFIVVQGVVGNLWRYINPFIGPYRAISRLFRWRAPTTVPIRVGAWIATATLLLFIAFSLADIAPDAPDRLALIVALYWLITLALLFVFGESWLARAECFTVLLNYYAQLAPLRRNSNNALSFGMPGWHAVSNPTNNIGAAVFVLCLLGSGSFDGLNETFKWLAFIGVNPLEFPGRSAVVDKTIAGLLLANVLLLVVFAACTYLGVALANKSAAEQERVFFISAFCKLALSMLPIAFAYHFAHFLTAFMVNAQYAVAAISDPLDSGADFLGIGNFYVTTGFMNSHHTVEAIWLTQAGAVVLGHVFSVIIAHAVALDLFGNARRAIISQAPLAAFMVLYTFIGLWLLAAPRGA